MIKIDISGNASYEIHHFVFDFNGTLAIDRRLIKGVKPLLKELADHASIHVITADTFCSVSKELGLAVLLANT